MHVNQITRKGSLSRFDLRQYDMGVKHDSLKLLQSIDLVLESTDFHSSWIPGVWLAPRVPETILKAAILTPPSLYRNGELMVQGSSADENIGSDEHGVISIYCWHNLNFEKVTS